MAEGKFESRAKLRGICEIANLENVFRVSLAGFCRTANASSCVHIQLLILGATANEDVAPCPACNMAGITEADSGDEGQTVQSQY